VNHLRSCLIATALLGAVACERNGLPAPQAPAKFYRVTEDGERLQTATVRLALDSNTQLTLIGVLHIAEHDYFAELNATLASYDTVLYEMLGKAEQTPLPPLPESARDHVLANRLGLNYQSSVLDYHSPRFVHADLDQAGLTALLSPDAPITSDGLLAILSNDQSPAERRRHILAHPDLVTSPGTSNPAIRLGRHERIFTRLSEARARGATNIAILYGASHLPAILAALPQAEVESTPWTTAWRAEHLPKR